MEYLVRFVQYHGSFRKPELEALASLADIDLKILDYSEYSPFCTIRLSSESTARTLIARSILALSIHELWGIGMDYSSLQASVKTRTPHLWSLYSQSSFKFTIDTFQGSISAAEQLPIIESYSFLPFNGPIRLRSPEQEFTIFADYALHAAEPRKLYLGRRIATGARNAIVEYSLKKRRYIDTTSMDAELALLTANMTHAGPGKLIYDPFVGTGSLTIAAAHFGAVAWGSDIDGRSVRGKGGVGLESGFGQYGLRGRSLGSFVADLTHGPIRGSSGGLFDGIVCDPPYGVREGLKVLGSRDGVGKEVVWIDGVAAHLRDQYIPPKRPYSFEAMLGDILCFAADNLVEGGRISLWMPTANDEDQDLHIPSHPALELVSVCVQPFSKWSRRLLTYSMRVEPGPSSSLQNLTGQSPSQTVEASFMSKDTGPSKPNPAHADTLNSFRRKYFQGFKPALPSEGLSDYRLG